MTLLSAFNAAREHPTREAVRAAEVVVNYAELGERVAAAVHALQSLGIDSQTTVAFAPGIDLDSVITIYALIELGAPILLLHPAQPDRRAFAMSRRAHVVLDPRWTPPQRREPLAQALTFEDSHDLALVSTSGSGGTPKTAVLTRGAFNAAAHASAANLGWQENDRWLLTLPPSHVGGFSVLTRCLIARRCVVLAADAGRDPEALFAVIEQQRVSLASVVPTTLHRILAAAPDRPPPKSLRALLVGGAPLASALRARAVAAGWPVIATYGCTEACSQIATQSPSQIGSNGSGAPLPGVEVRIVEERIQVRAPTLLRGYLAADGLYSPLSADGWYDTGDLGAFLEDGQLQIHGRADDVIIVGGHNVSPQRVEQTLSEIPGIQDACVFGIDDAEWGQRVAAVLVTEGGSFPSGALQIELRARLSKHEAPSLVHFVDKLPDEGGLKRNRSAVRHAFEKSLRGL